MIPYGKHSLFPEDIEAVTKVLQEGFLTQGEQTPLFEKAVSNQVEYSRRKSSGTQGHHHESQLANGGIGEHPFEIVHHQCHGPGHEGGDDADDEDHL